MIATSVTQKRTCHLSICHMANAVGNAKKQTPLAIAKSIIHDEITVSHVWINH
ncbi:hypothetical protein CLV67_12311 [Actinoplanes italicus]|uniref:Uncharacterized protein n=1 Tax=Actinoplanes italicus TaxID=113567 RepID=A0A2T0JYM5_9ACTN|nr:hypothetical protein CLV67_12311 [Actinoplanes italicus]